VCAQAWKMSSWTHRPQTELSQGVQTTQGCGKYRGVAGGTTEVLEEPENIWLVSGVELAQFPILEYK